MSRWPSDHGVPHPQRLSLFTDLDGGDERCLAERATTALAPASSGAEIGIVEFDPTTERVQAVSLSVITCFSLCLMRHAAL